MAQSGWLSNATETVDIGENNPKKNRIKIVSRESGNYKSYICTRNVFVHMKILIDLGIVIIGQIQNFSIEIYQYWLILKKAYRSTTDLQSV